MKSLRAKTSVLIVASGIILTAIGLFWLSAGRGTRDARVYRIGWESDPPFQVALADGEPSGLAIELVREAARRRNIRLEWIRRQRAGEASLVNQQVDLWPLMTITQRRKKRFHISEAYLVHGFFFLVRQDTPYRRVEDLEQRTLSHLDQPIVTDLAKEHFPRARLIARPTVKDALAEVCESRVDGAFVEENSALSTLLDGIPCAGLPVRMIGIPSIRTHLGVAATFGAAGVADEIREEIGTIAKEGRLSLMASRWGDFSVRDTETIQSLREARQRVSILVVAILVFACLLLLAMWQTIHRGREANRAIRAEQTLRQTEQKLQLRESEERFRHIADTAPVIVWITDSHTLHTFFNRQAAALTGRKIEELLGHSWIELTHPEDRESLLPVYMSALKAGRDFQLEFRLRRADQAYRWMLSTGTARWESGAYVGHVGTILDITDLKRNQEEIIATQSSRASACWRPVLRMISITSWEVFWWTRSRF